MRKARRRAGAGLFFTSRRAEPAAPAVEAAEGEDGFAEPAAPAVDAAEGEDGFQLLNALISTDVLLDVIRFLPAASTARLSSCARNINERVMHPDAATWCAESRRALLSSRNQRGDLPLADVGDAGWTLERLHLCEHPPRFPRIYFNFASDALEKGAKRRVKRVARLLIRHPRLLVRIHGFAQPNAPNIIGEALSQARAISVRKELLQHLAGSPEWADELDDDDDSSSDRPFRRRRPRVVGSKLQAVGRWREQPTNRNFDQTESDCGDEDSDEAEIESSRYDGDGNELRRAEFTLLGLAA